GTARTAAERDSVIAAAEAAAREGGLNLTTRIALAVGPLDLAELRAAVNQLATCGPLEVTGGDGRSLPPGASVTIGGATSRPEERGLIENGIRPLLQGRPLTLQLGVINPPVCKVLNILPAKSDPRYEFTFTHGDRPGNVENGTYRSGENPVIKLRFPAELTGYLDVFFAGVDDSAYNLLPHVNRPEHALEDIGTVTNGTREITISYPVAEDSPSTLAMEVADPFGVNLLVAVVTPRPLFNKIPILAMSIEAFMEEVEPALRAQAGRAVFGYRFLVTQP
ncbi:MAG TPA: hypothetical protein VFR34_14835, partial [Paracoccaceae bacterium]|nr:hypothetical protein [Paracoccaceae bacterium]